MIKTYTAKYTRIPSGYMGQLIEWPEVITEGKNLDDCRALLQDALQEMMAAYRQQEKEVPAKTKMKNHAKKSRTQKFPPGWNEKRVRKVLAHYENQSEEEAVAEDERAFEAEGQTVMIVPSVLVPKIRDLVARRRSK